MGKGRDNPGKKNKAASSAHGTIKLEFVVKPGCRTSEGMARVNKLLRNMGVAITSSGLATISANVKERHFKALFKTSALRVSSQPIGEFDFGSSPGFKTEPLPIPEEFRDCIENISASPAYTRMQHRKQKPKAKEQS